MNKWTSTATTPNPLTIDNTLNVAPAGGTYSALLNTSADRMHHNIIADNGGLEVGKYFLFTSYWYDEIGTATRFFNEVRGYSGGTGVPNGGTTASGSLAQLLAIGKYNSTTLAGDTYDGTKYQARVVFGTTTGWFNLNGAGAPSRSTGWHKFAIERMDDGTTVNFYVDDILSRTIVGTAAETIDTVVLGSGLGSTIGNAWTDGISLIPEPSAMALGLVGLGLLLRKKLAR